MPQAFLSQKRRKVLFLSFFPSKFNLFLHCPRSLLSLWNTGFAERAPRGYRQPPDTAHFAIYSLPFEMAKSDQAECHDQGAEGINTVSL